MNEDYLEFLMRKIPMAKFDGYEIADEDIHQILKPHQRACVKWAVKGGNRALFESFGLGKSLQQLEIVRITKGIAGGSGLIVCPLGVRQEFKRDGAMIEIENPFLMDDGAWKKVRSADCAGDVETWCLRVEEDASFSAEGCIVANCPLQFDIVDRLINRYSNPGDLVYDPFCGLGTVPYRAIKAGRKGMGSELNTAYFFDSVQYLKAMEQERSMPDLFALEGVA